MQLTSPAFLFLFLPLSLPLVLLLPGRFRRLAFTLLSVIFYTAANAGNPWGLLHIALLTAFAVIMAYLPVPHSIKGGKIRTVMGVTVPLASLLAARILAEYGPQGYLYPVGLFFLTLGCVSFAVDAARGDTVRPKNPPELVGYLLFFPTMAMGPILKSRDFFDLTEAPAFSPALFCDGIRAFMLGYVKRLAVAAVLLRTVADILQYADRLLHPVSLLLLLLLSYLCFWFFVTGTADMATGICRMYGIAVPRRRMPLLFTSPHLLPAGVLPSLRHLLLDYCYLPMCRRFGGKGARLLLTLSLTALMALAFRTRPEMLLFALPMLLFAGLSLSKGCRRILSPRHPLLRLLWSLLSLLLTAPYTLAVLLDRPMQFFTLCATAFRYEGAYYPHYIFGMIQDTRYLMILGGILLLLLPYLRFRPLLLRRSKGKTVLAVAETALLFGAFFLCLLYFLPQFPQNGSALSFLM